MSAAMQKIQPQSHEDRAIEQAVAAFANAQIKTTPYTYWLFEGALMPETCEQIVTLPISPAEGYDTQGKRDNHNELRRFISPEVRKQYKVFDEITQTYQDKSVIKSLEKLCSISFSGSYLRVEYCQDSDGFWLEPHMDIKEKLVTIQIYLNNGPDAETLGTDIYNADKSHFGTAPSTMNQGMIFLPKEPNSFHGFEKRRILATRRSLIINYVTNEWRARHELAFPSNPIA